MRKNMIRLVAGLGEYIVTLFREGEEIGKTSIEDRSGGYPAMIKKSIYAY